MFLLEQVVNGLVLGGYYLLIALGLVSHMLRSPRFYATVAVTAIAVRSLQQIGQRFAEIKPHANEKVVVHCKSGGRSMQFTQILRAQGFKDVKSMAGGILLGLVAEKLEAKIAHAELDEVRRVRDECGT